MLDEQQGHRADIKDVGWNQTSSCDDKEEDGPRRSAWSPSGLASLCVETVDHLQDSTGKENSIDDNNGI